MITVLEGTLPDASTACTLIGQLATVSVTLVEPLGGRQVRHTPTNGGTAAAEDPRADQRGQSQSPRSIGG